MRGTQNGELRGLGRALELLFCEERLKACEVDHFRLPLDRNTLESLHPAREGCMFRYLQRADDMKGDGMGSARGSFQPLLSDGAQEFADTRVLLQVQREGEIFRCKRRSGVAVWSAHDADHTGALVVSVCKLLSCAGVLVHKLHGDLSNIGRQWLRI